MKKLFDILRWAAIVFLASPFILAWIPGMKDALLLGTNIQYWHNLVASFQQLSITLGSTLLVALTITLLLGYFSILWPVFGKFMASLLDSIEAIPAILIALFCYAPVSAILATNSAGNTMILSLLVFIFAATITTLPESVRGITLPLGELYHRKYSVSFRSYGFSKGRILFILMNTRAMRDVARRTSASILLKTLVLDCSFGFIIQIGMGSYGTPAHLSPGALIAANRQAVFGSNLYGSEVPMMFWLPVLLLVMISLACLLTLGTEKERQQ